MTKLEPRWLHLCAFAMWAVAAFAFAGEQSTPKLEQEALFHIEKGPVEAALIQFSRQAEMQIVLAPDSAANATASAVNGRLAAGAALTALLKGTGLVYSTVGNTVMVQTSENENKESPTDEPRRSTMTKILKSQRPGAAL